MEIDALRAFLAVAETGSFSSAAERIFVTQPAISKRIAVLERELEVRLFDRIGRRVDLTPAGRALLPRAQSIINEVRDATRSISNLAGEVAGQLRIATSHHIGLHRLPSALKHFNQQYPAARLDLRFMDSEQGCAAVAKGDVELAVVTLPERADPHLRLIPIWPDPLEIVVGATHALGQRPEVGAADLISYPAILPGTGTYTREIILEAFAPLRNELTLGMSTNYLEVLKMLVAIGLGWSALPHTMIDEELKVVQIEKVRIERTLGVVNHVGRTLSNAAVTFIDILKTSA